MTMPVGRQWEGKSAAAVLAAALILSPGCGREGSGLQQPPEPAQRNNQADATRAASDAASDLKRDLKPPVVEPGGQPVRSAPPAGTKAGTP